MLFGISICARDFRVLIH